MSPSSSIPNFPWLHWASFKVELNLDSRFFQFKLKVYSSQFKLGVNLSFGLGLQARARACSTSSHCSAGSSSKKNDLFWWNFSVGSLNDESANFSRSTIISSKWLVAYLTRRKGLSVASLRSRAEIDSFEFFDRLKNVFEATWGSNNSSKSTASNCW